MKICLFLFLLLYMTTTWVYILPLFAYSLSKKVKECQRSVKAGNLSKAKADSFFIFLMVLVFAVIISADYLTR